MMVIAKNPQNPNKNIGKATIKPPTVPQVPGAFLGKPEPNPTPSQYTHFSKVVALGGQGGQGLDLRMSGLWLLIRVSDLIQ